MEPLSRSFGSNTRTTDHVTDACLVATIETMGSWKKVTNSRAQSAGLNKSQSKLNLRVPGLKNGVE
jgi:hypothetical protein